MGAEGKSGDGTSPPPWGSLSPRPILSFLSLPSSLSYGGSLVCSPSSQSFDLHFAFRSLVGVRSLGPPKKGGGSALFSSCHKRPPHHIKGQWGLASARSLAALVGSMGLTLALSLSATPNKSSSKSLSLPVFSAWVHATPTPAQGEKTREEEKGLG